MRDKIEQFLYYFKTDRGRHELAPILKNIRLSIFTFFPIVGTIVCFFLFGLFKAVLFLIGYFVVLDILCHIVCWIDKLSVEHL